MMKACKRFLILVILFHQVWRADVLFAEGTKQLNPTASDTSQIQIIAANGSKSTFAAYTSNANQRLYIHICHPGETVYMGFNSKLPAKFRVKNPNGNIEFAERNVPVASSPIGTVGKINTYTEAILGPKPIDPNGYSPFSFVASQSGDYYIEFDISARGTGLNGNNYGINMFDITVVDTIGNRRDGRIWSQAWMVNSGALENPFNASLYIYTTDQIVTKVNMNGIKPYEFIISSNNTGTNNSGDVAVDRKSKAGNFILPLYKIFLNNPDTSCYPTGDLGSLVEKPTITGCPGNYCINVNVNAAGEVLVLMDLNGIEGFQAGTKDKLIQFSLKKGANCVPWNGQDGLGAKITGALNVSVDVKYVNGITHLPIFDVEKHPNGYEVSYVRPIPVGSNQVSLFWDDTNFEINAKSPLNGCTGGCHRWDGPAGSQNTLGNNRTLNTWWYVAQDTADLAYSYTENTIDANKSTLGNGKLNDTTVCASTKEISLKGSLTGDTISKWSKLTGTGTIENPDTLATKYTISSTDVNLTSVKLVLSSVNVTGCPVIKDTITIFLDPIPKLTMPVPFQICSNNTTINTNATIVNAGGIAWKSGDGKFVDSLSTSIQYKPSQKELDSSYVKLYATTLPKAGQLCPMVKDSVKVSVYLPATLQAPADTIVCQPSTSINLVLKANSINSDSVTWLSNGVVPIKKQGLSPTFSLSNGNAFSIFLVAYKKGCNPIKDTVNVKFEAQPVISANLIDTCSPDLRVKLLGTSSLGMAKGKATWTSSGTGSFLLDKDTLTNAYIPSKLDSTAGQVSLKLTSKGQVFCPVKESSLVYKIIPLPKASAGNDTLVCIGSFISRKTIANSDWTYEWRTSASGSIISTNPIYTFVASQDTTTFLTVKNSRLCEAIDNSVVSIEQKPTISATPTFTCLPNLQVDLEGTSIVTGSGIWSSSGNGNFGSNATVLSPNSYIPSKQDSAKGDVTLKLTSLGQAVCTAAETTFLYKIIPLPKASAGNDSLVCINSSINLASSQNNDWEYEWKRTKLGAILSATNKLSLTANLDTNKVYLKVLNSRNCEVSDSAIIITITPPTITLQPDFCLYSAQNISAIVTNAPNAGVYDWKLNNKSLGVSNKSLPIDTAGNYSYHFSFKNGCNSSNTVQAFEPPKLKVADTSACLNGKITLIANQITNANYFWGTPAVNNGTNKFDITLTAPISNFKILVVDQNNCQASDEVKLDISPSPKFSLSGVDLCEGETKKLTATLDPLSNPPISHTWTRNGIQIQTTKWEELEYNQGGNYSLKLGIKGCFETQSRSIFVKPNPKINMPLVYKHCFETDPALTIIAQPFKKYTWVSEGIFLDTLQNIKVAPEKDTYYFLKVENSFGCKDSTKLLVRKVCAPRLFVPNVMTPESNDVNAKLQIFGANYTNFEITIFSRWGEVLFNSKDPQKVWNGDYLNEKMPIGNYQWQVTYEGDTEEYKGPYKKTGDVAILR